MQTLSAASFYLDHLDGRTPIIVITSLLSPNIAPRAPARGKMSEADSPAFPTGGERPASRQAAVCDDASEHVKLVDELLQLLDIG